MRYALTSLGFSTPGSFRQLPPEKLEELFQKITTKINSLNNSTSAAQQQLKSLIEDDLMKNFRMNLQDFELPWGHQFYVRSIHKYCLEITDPIPLIFENELTSAISTPPTLQNKHVVTKIIEKSDLVNIAKKHAESLVHETWKAHKVKEIMVDVTDGAMWIGCCYCDVIIKACEQKFSNFVRHLGTLHGSAWGEGNNSKRPRTEPTLPSITIPSMLDETNQSSSAMSISPDLVAGSSTTDEIALPSNNVSDFN